MVDIIIGESVINKSGETGTIVSFDDKFIVVDFKARTTKIQRDAFEKGFLKYEKADLQTKTKETIKRIEIEEELIAEEKIQEERRLVESKTAGMYSQIQYDSISLRLDPVSINFKYIEEKEYEKLIRDVFKECDKDTMAVYDAFNPKMEYSKMTSRSRTRYCVGFLCKYLDTYVFRVFSRDDIYKKRVRTGVTVFESDTTEIIRVLYINGHYYHFMKNIVYSYGTHKNSSGFVRWHIIPWRVKDILLNEVVRLCDCEYLNDYISEQNINCYQYTKLLMPALYDNKVEIVFKKKLFSSVHYIDDIVSYLAPFSSKQIDFASKNNFINALPVIKNCGCYDLDVLEHMERLLSGYYNTYHWLEKVFEERGFNYSNLYKMLIDFIKKVEDFDVVVYHDFLRLINTRPGLTINDFFDKNYVAIHDEMSRYRYRGYNEKTDKAYARVAKSLSWIDREENGYFIIVPKTIVEIRYEGENQHNCVFKAGYYENVISHKSIIVFLRKEKDTSYVTIEFDYETFDVIQAYGQFNRKIDTDLYKYIVALGKRLYVERFSQQ